MCLIGLYLDTKYEVCGSDREMKKNTIAIWATMFESTIAQTDSLSPKWSPNDKTALFTIAIWAIFVVNYYSPDRFTIAFATGLLGFVISAVGEILSKI